MSNSSIWAIDKTLSGATTPGQSGPGSNGNEGVLHIPQSSNITEVSASDCLVSYTGHSLGESYPSAKMQFVYSTAPASWACCTLIWLSQQCDRKLTKSSGMYLLTPPTQSISKSLTSLNSKISKAKEHSLPYYLPITLSSSLIWYSKSWHPVYFLQQ